jgi:CRP-like cAMP-binding protein
MIVIMSDALLQALRAAGAADQALRPGAFLFHRGGPVLRMFAVMEGCVDLIRYQADGNAVVLQRAREGEILAEASLFSEHYHCDARASGETRVLALPRPALKERLRRDGELAELWIGHLSRQLQRARLQSEILSLNRVGERLDLWLDRNDGALPPRGEWTALARALGVTREALYREMARRRRSSSASASAFSCPGGAEHAREPGDRQVMGGGR